METAEKMFKKLEDNSESISIKRIPKDIKKQFIDLANAQEGGFCGDYGMLLKFLIDNYRNAQQFELLWQEIAELKEQMKTKTVEPQKTNSIRLLNGRTIER